MHINVCACRCTQNTRRLPHLETGSMYTCTCRNEQFQEELWRISCDLLKDWMSPEIWSKYSTASQHTVTQSSNGDGGNVTDNTTTTVDNEDKPPAVAISNDDSKLTDDKQPQDQ